MKKQNTKKTPIWLCAVLILLWALFLYHAFFLFSEPYNRSRGLDRFLVISVVSFMASLIFIRESPLRLKKNSFLLFYTTIIILTTLSFQIMSVVIFAKGIVIERTLVLKWREICKTLLLEKKCEKPLEDTYYFYFYDEKTKIERAIERELLKRLNLKNHVLKGKKKVFLDYSITKKELNKIKREELRKLYKRLKNKAIKKKILMSAKNKAQEEEFNAPSSSY